MVWDIPARGRPALSSDMMVTMDASMRALVWRAWDPLDRIGLSARFRTSVDWSVSMRRVVIMGTREFLRQRIFLLNRRRRWLQRDAKPGCLIMKGVSFIGQISCMISMGITLLYT